MMRRYGLMALLLCWSGLLMASVSLTINPPAVRLGESFHLILTNDEPQSGGIPNLVPLQENFTVIGTQRSMLYSIVNGQTKAESQWIIILTAKKTGVLTIPPIEVGPQQTMAGSIEVTGDQITTSDDNQGDTPQAEVMLKTEVSVQKPFINQQVIYTVKLYNSQRLLEADYKPPSVEDALLVPLGDGRRYQTTLGSRGYMVEEQQYAVFPQKSGDLTIVAPSFRALVLDSVPRRINAQANATHLQVQPKPASYSGLSWLPATQVALTERYDQTNTMMKQGDTLVRTVTLQAAGVPAQLLPPFTVTSGPEFNAYTEKPTLKNTAKQQELVGRADVKVTYLLNKAGKITLPAYHVAWFNTLTGKEELASLPERTLEVEAVQGAAVKIKPTLTAQAMKKTLAMPSIPSRSMGTFIAWVGRILGGVILLALVVALSWWLIQRRSLGRRHRMRIALKQLHSACTANHPQQARDALLAWGRLRWPRDELLNLYHLTRLAHDSSLKKQLSLLSQALYSPDRAIQWQGDALWRSVRSYLNTKPAAKSKPNDLPPIHRV